MTNESLEQALIDEVCHLNPLHDGECQVFFSPEFTDIIQSFRESIIDECKEVIRDHEGSDFLGGKLEELKQGSKQ